MVVDTMVFAYALLGVPRFRDESAEVLESADDIIVPDSFRAELGNVVWQWGREHDLDRGLCHAVLEDAEALITKVVPVDLISAQALDFSLDRNHPFYDTLFLAAAPKARNESRDVRQEAHQEIPRACDVAIRLHEDSAVRGYLG